MITKQFATAIGVAALAGGILIGAVGVVAARDAASGWDGTGVAAHMNQMGAAAHMDADDMTAMMQSMGGAGMVGGAGMMGGAGRMGGAGMMSGPGVPADLHQQHHPVATPTGRGSR